MNPKQKSKHSAWETPDPGFWTANDYVVVRADERGTGNSPGRLDSMSSATCDGFVDVIEWAASQPWSTGKVGLLGISYYAGSQWRAAARKPTGLACIVPWEGNRSIWNSTGGVPIKFGLTRVQECRITIVIASVMVESCPIDSSVSYIYNLLTWGTYEILII